MRDLGRLKSSGIRLGHSKASRDICTFEQGGCERDASR